MPEVSDEDSTEPDLDGGRHDPRGDERVADEPLGPSPDPSGSDGSERPPGADLSQDDRIPDAEDLPDEVTDEDSPLNPFERVREIVTGDAELSLQEVSERSGLPQQILRQIFDAIDWADRPGYDERDVEYAEAAARILDHYPMESVIRTLRTRYRAVASIVVSDLGTVRDRIVMPALASGDDPEQLAERLGDTAAEILPLITAQLAEDYRHVLVNLLDSEALSQGVSLEQGREIELAVGFVDVEGFTSLSGQVDPAGLDRVLTGFEDLVANSIAETESMLLAKFVGDAAMIVSSDPLRLADTLLGLVEDRRVLAEAPRRAGMACGPVLVREGDYYGPVVNLAARLTDHAREWSMLVAEDLEEQLAEHFSLSRIPEVDIRGIGERRPYRLRRAAED
jgi:adenylate cyclase